MRFNSNSKFENKIICSDLAIIKSTYNHSTLQIIQVICPIIFITITVFIIPCNKVIINIMNSMIFYRNYFLSLPIITSPYAIPRTIRFRLFYSSPINKNIVPISTLFYFRIYCRNNFLTI